MKTAIRTACFLAVVFPLLLLGQGKQDQLNQLAEKVDQHYDHLKTMRAHFVEDYHGAGTARTESGTLWLKKPGKMLWEYDQPRKKQFLSDGKTAWFYVPGEQQACKEPVNKLDDIRSPLRFLLGKTKLRKEFNELGVAPNIKPEKPGNVVLRGSPKGLEERVPLVILEVTPEGQIDRIQIEETGGAVTDFHFTEVMDNVAVADRLFQFTPPKGVEAVECTYLGD